MARIDPAHGAFPPPPFPLSHDVVPVSKNRKHKIVLESVTQEKRRLLQRVTFDPKPPLGFTFIPAGNPELTNALKEASRKANTPIYTVTTTPHANVHDLSQQVHRIGYHFSSLVVADICHLYGIQLSASGHVVGTSYETFLKGYRGRGAPGSEEEGWDQITLNTKARDAIKDLFPNIPDNDLFQIIKTAFQKGKKRVGTASELPLARRAQLAVVAHIRHCYTAYDRLLRNGGYHDARGVVEKPTLAKLVEWRGDDENGAKVLEDIFREVVVISEEEQSDDDDYDPEAPLKELSVEVVSKQTHTEPQSLRSSWTQRVSSFQDGMPQISDDEVPSNVHFLPRKPKMNEQQRDDRRRLTHNQAWNAARERYRPEARSQILGLPNEPAPSFEPRRPPNPSMSDPGYHSHPQEPPHTTYRPGLGDARERHSYNELPPDTIMGADGAIYTRIPSPPRGINDAHSHPHPVAVATPYDPTRPAIPDNIRPPPPPLMTRYQHDRRISDPYTKESEIALPSIEDEQTNVVPLDRRTNDTFGKDDWSRPRVTPPSNRHEAHVVDLTNSAENHPPKKRRIDDVTETDVPYRTSPYKPVGPLKHYPPALGRRLEYTEQVDTMHRPEASHSGRHYFDDGSKPNVRHEGTLGSFEHGYHDRPVHYSGQPGPQASRNQDREDFLGTVRHNDLQQASHVPIGPNARMQDRELPLRELRVFDERGEERLITYHNPPAPVYPRQELVKHNGHEYSQDFHTNLTDDRDRHLAPWPYHSSGDDALRRDLPPVVAFPRFDGAEREPAGHAYAGRIQPPNDYLPTRLENLVMDQPRTLPRDYRDRPSQVLKEYAPQPPPAISGQWSGDRSQDQTNHLQRYGNASQQDTGRLPPETPRQRYTDASQQTNYVLTRSHLPTNNPGGTYGGTFVEQKNGPNRYPTYEESRTWP